MRPLSTFTSDCSARLRSHEKRGGLENLCFAIAASTDSKTYGGLPIDLPVRALSSRFIWLSTRISFSVICGKLTANEMMVGPAPEWPMTIAFGHFITPHHRQHVVEQRVERIVLARAPGGIAPAAAVGHHHLAVGGERGGDLDPVDRVVVVRAVQDQDRRGAGLAEDAIKQCHVTGVDAPGAVFVRHHNLPEIFLCRYSRRFNAVAAPSGNAAGRRTGRAARRCLPSR